MDQDVIEIVKKKFLSRFLQSLEEVTGELGKRLESMKKPMQKTVLVTGEAWINIDQNTLALLGEGF